MTVTTIKATMMQKTINSAGFVTGSCDGVM
jgi:hypothetical protein